MKTSWAWTPASCSSAGEVQTRAHLLTTLTSTLEANIHKGHPPGIQSSSLPQVCPRSTPCPGEIHTTPNDPLTPNPQALDH